MSTIRPIGDHVVVRPMKQQETISGIVLPDTANDAKTDRGTVIAVGPGRTLDDGTLSTMEVQAGDEILFSKYAPDEIEVDGEKFLILSASDIKATIEA